MNLSGADEGYLIIFNRDCQNKLCETTNTINEKVKIWKQDSK